MHQSKIYIDILSKYKYHVNISIAFDSSDVRCLIFLSSDCYQNDNKMITNAPAARIIQGMFAVIGY